MPDHNNAMKRIRLDDETYRLLVGAKIYTSESFSMVVKRLLGTRRPIGESAGAWSDMTDEEVNRLRRETLETFESMKE